MTLANCTASCSNNIPTNLGQLGSAFLDAVFHPCHNGVKNLLLAPHIQLIAGDDVNQLVGRKQHELLTFHYLQSHAEEDSSLSESALISVRL